MAVDPAVENNSDLVAWMAECKAMQQFEQLGLVVRIVQVDLGQLADQVMAVDEIVHQKRPQSVRPQPQYHDVSLPVSSQPRIPSGYGLCLLSPVTSLLCMWPGGPLLIVRSEPGRVKNSTINRQPAPAGSSLWLVARAGFIVAGSKNRR